MPGDVVVGFGEGLAVGVDGYGASVVVAEVVVANPVYAEYEALVLQGACLKEYVPHPATAVGPVGYVDDGIVG